MLRTPAKCLGVTPSKPRVYGCPVCELTCSKNGVSFPGNTQASLYFGASVTGWLSPIQATSPIYLSHSLHGSSPDVSSMLLVSALLLFPHPRCNPPWGECLSVWVDASEIAEHRGAQRLTRTDAGELVEDQISNLSGPRSNACDSTEHWRTRAISPSS